MTTPHACTGHKTCLVCLYWDTLRIPANYTIDSTSLTGTDYMPGGWGIDDSITFCRALKQLGVDLIDCSSGAVVRGAKIRVGPGYQVHHTAHGSNLLAPAC